MPRPLLLSLCLTLVVCFLRLVVSLTSVYDCMHMDIVSDFAISLQLNLVAHLPVY